MNVEELVKNKDVLIANKKSEIKTKNSLAGFYNSKTATIKGIPDMSDDYIYPVISNTNYMDSHDDVHLTNSMNKTAKEQNGKIYYVADHKLEVDSIIATPKNVEIMLVDLDWNDLGKDYQGRTEALIFKIAKDKIIHEKFKRMIDNKENLQNSIRMQIVKLHLAVNNPEFKAEYKDWTKNYSQIANKEVADEKGYFWGIEELKIHLEGSAVLFGSNDATPTEPLKNTQSEPLKDTQKELEQFYNLLKI